MKLDHIFTKSHRADAGARCDRVRVGSNQLTLPVEASACAQKLSARPLFDVLTTSMMQAPLWQTASAALLGIETDLSDKV